MASVRATAAPLASSMTALFMEDMVRRAPW
jgi:hypothetical protein